MDKQNPKPITKERAAFLIIRGLRTAKKGVVVMSKLPEEDQIWALKKAERKFKQFEKEIDDLFNK